MFGAQELLLLLFVVIPLSLIVWLVVFLLRRSGRSKAAPANPVPQSQVAQGWYDDPSSPTHLRYWDGVRWTDQTATKSQDVGGSHE